MTTGSGDCNHRHRGTATSSTKAPSSAPPAPSRSEGASTNGDLPHLPHGSRAHRPPPFLRLRAPGVRSRLDPLQRGSCIPCYEAGIWSHKRPATESSKQRHRCLFDRASPPADPSHQPHTWGPLVRRTAVGRWPCRPSRRFFGCVPWQPSGGEPTSYAEPIAAIQEARPSRDALLANVHAAAGSAEQGVGPNCKVSRTNRHLRGGTFSMKLRVLRRLLARPFRNACRAVAPSRMVVDAESV